MQVKFSFGSAKAHICLLKYIFTSTFLVFHNFLSGKENKKITSHIMEYNKQNNIYYNIISILHEIGLFVDFFSWKL